MDKVEDVTLFAIQYSENGLDLCIDIDTTGGAESPNYMLSCEGVIINSIQNCFTMGNGFPTYVAYIDTQIIDAEVVPLKLKELGFSFRGNEKYWRCYKVIIESGDFLAEIICKWVKYWLK